MGDFYRPERSWLQLGRQKGLQTEFRETQGEKRGKSRINIPILAGKSSGRRKKIREIQVSFKSQQVQHAELCLPLPGSETQGEIWGS